MNRHLRSRVNHCTKYNVTNVLNVLNATTFQSYLFAEGTYTPLECCIYLN